MSSSIRTKIYLLQLHNASEKMASHQENFVQPSLLFLFLSIITDVLNILYYYFMSLEMLQSSWSARD